MSLPRARLLTVLALVCAASLTAAPPAAARGSCAKPKLKVSKRLVSDGGRLRVRGYACRRRAPGRVRIQVKVRKHWRTVARTRARHSGRFRKRVQIRASGRRNVRIRARFTGRRSRRIRVRIRDKNCSLNRPGAVVEMALPGCRVVGSDTAAQRDSSSFWGFVACQDSTREQQVAGAADPHPTARGRPQADANFRRLSVLDGDNPFNWGERCELGENDHRYGPTALYREGQRRVTFVSIRLPSNFPLETSAWQSVLQMKQAQPADGGGGVPILMMDAMRGQWLIDSSNGVHWSFPAQRNVWTRFAFDVFYSQDPTRGWLQVSGDLNADGDFADGNERSPVIRTPTLKAEIDGPNGTSDRLAPGDSIPSHLRAGVYHNPSIPCPAPGGCSAEVDNVQVVAP